MNKFTDFLSAFLIAVLTGIVFFALAYLVIFNVAPPEDPATTGNLGLGQVFLALAFTATYVYLMTKYIYRWKRRRQEEKEPRKSVLK